MNHEYCVSKIFEVYIYFEIRPYEHRYEIVADTRIPANNTAAIMAALETGPVACGVHAEGLIGYVNSAYY